MPDFSSQIRPEVRSSVGASLQKASAWIPVTEVPGSNPVRSPVGLGGMKVPSWGIFIAAFCLEVYRLRDRQGLGKTIL